MQRRMMKSKIHRATVTDADLHYVGSITLDTHLMDLADVQEYEQVHVLDIDNGARFETYAIAGGPGEVCINGAAARLVQPGDRVIILSYADYDAEELDAYEPRVIHVDRANHAVDPVVAAELARSDQRGRARYREVEADVDRSLVALDTGLDELN